MRLSAIEVIQLAVVMPATLATFYPLVFGGALIWSIAGGESGRNFWPAFYMLGSAFSMVCLWVAIVFNPERIYSHKPIFAVVMLGLGFGCVISGLIIWWHLQGAETIRFDTLFFYGSPLLLGAINLIRMARCLIAMSRSDDQAERV